MATNPWSYFKPKLFKLTRKLRKTRHFCFGVLVLVQSPWAAASTAKFCIPGTEEQGEGKKNPLQLFSDFKYYVKGIEYQYINIQCSANHGSTSAGWFSIRLGPESIEEISITKRKTKSQQVCSFLETSPLKWQTNATLLEKVLLFTFVFP